jgi:propionyl-CoA carboxylase alpha chain
MGNARFREGRFTTGFIDEEFKGGFAGVVPSKAEATEFAAIATIMQVIAETRPRHDFVVKLGDEGRAVTCSVSSGAYQVAVDGIPVDPIQTDWKPGATLATFAFGGRKRVVKTNAVRSGWRLRRRGMDVTAQVMSPRIAELAKLMPKKAVKDTSKLLLSPMPGLLRQLAVKEGDKIEAGQALATVEAMKMENILRAERHGRVKGVLAKVGENLSTGQTIMEFA